MRRIENLVHKILMPRMKPLFLSVQIFSEHTKMIDRYGERFVLDPRGSLYWKRKRWLVISDLHFGKTMHFRKKGMAVPSTIDAKDLNVVERLIANYRPNKVILLGDLFHSDYNGDWERVAKFTHDYRKGLFLLVRGNHDILPDWHYGRSQIELVDEIKSGPFWFTHIPEEEPGDWINMCGHLHPGVRLYGKAKQSMRLPAFFFRSNSVLLPAFGRFTGSISIKPRKSDQVVAIVEDSLVIIQ